MEYSFFDMNCSIGGKNVLVPGVCYEKDSVKKTLESINVKRAFCSHNGAALNGDFESNRILNKEIGNDQFFLPSYTLIVNNGKENAVEEFEKILKEDNVKLMNINNLIQGYSLDLFTMSDYFDVMDSLSLCVNIPFGCVSDGWLDEVLSCYKNMNIILNSYGFTNRINVRKLMKKHNNFILDTTYGITEGIESIVNEFGSERIVFASYAPETSPLGFAGRVILSSLSREAKDNIAYKNAQRLTGEVL